MELEPLATFKEFQINSGTYYNSVSTILNPSEDLTVIDKSTSKILFILRKNVISNDIIEKTVSSYLPIIKKMTSTNRGHASGKIKKDLVNNEDTTTNVSSVKYDKSPPVHSTIVGYIDSLNNKYPCRLTQFSKKHFETYQTGIPLIECVNELFKESLPIQHKSQLELANKTKFRINNTAFTTVTVNYNFQTALHVDRGDYIDGFGTLLVYSKGVTGGCLLFPRFDVGVQVSNGDLLLLNVHEYHCNNKITLTEQNSYRMSFVFYLRTRLLDCRQNKMLDDLGVSGKFWNTNIIIDKILEKIKAPKKDLSSSDKQPSNEQQWIIETDTYKFICKNRQYKLYDKFNKKQIINLYNIWQYLESLT
jgi:hypothetical protein